MKHRAAAIATPLCLSVLTGIALSAVVSKAQAGRPETPDAMSARVARLERQVTELHRVVESLKVTSRILTLPETPGERPEPNAPQGAVPFKEFNGTMYYLYPLKKDGSAPSVMSVAPTRPAK